MSQPPSDDHPTEHVSILQAGSAVGPYRIARRIGAGGMAEVYLADDTRLGRRVALKFLGTHLARDPKTRARFDREGRVQIARFGALMLPEMFTLGKGFSADTAEQALPDASDVNDFGELSTTTGANESLTMRTLANFRTMNRMGFFLFLNNGSTADVHIKEIVLYKVA